MHFSMGFVILLGIIIMLVVRLVYSGSILSSAIKLHCESSYVPIYSTIN